MRNEDDFGTLLERIESLPGEMRDLYLQMWKRLNGDEQIYGDEAAKYFSYGPHFPLAIFEMLVALDEPLQTRYLSSEEPQDPDHLIRQCEKLKLRILSRSAGLLEMVDADDSVSRHSRKDNPLFMFQQTKIQYMHRTARDFLLSTEAGQGLLGASALSTKSVSRNVVIAGLAAYIQGVTGPSESSIFELLNNVLLLGSENEIELVSVIRRAYERGGYSRPLRQNSYYFCMPGSKQSLKGGASFESVAAFHGCATYIPHFVENEIQSASPYYCGLLVLCAAQGLNSQNASANISLMSWFCARGADVCTNHVFNGTLVSPLSRMFLSVVSLEVAENQQLAKPALGLIEQMVPSSLETTIGGLAVFWSSNGWRFGPKMPQLGEKHNVNAEVVVDAVLVEVSTAKLAVLTMQYFEEHACVKPQWR